MLAALGLFFVGLSAQQSEAAAWKCGKRHCFWTENYTDPVPDFAKDWGPPTCPGGYYVHSRFSKKWTQVCPPH